MQVVVEHFVERKEVSPMGQRDNERGPEPGWEAATWAGARREQRRRWAALPLERIVAAQEEMYELSVAMGHESSLEPARAETEGAAVHEPRAQYGRGGFTRAR